ncbi:MAG TPA: outer membrane beta-barrel protein [Ignavibacteria bacterium]|nr:outer membrane beta-barrel protein [Ignavibacteria bacterium]
MKKYILLLIFILSSVSQVSAQIIKTDNLSLYTHLDIYYPEYIKQKNVAYPFNFYSRSNERIKLYNASLTAHFREDDIRSNITVQYGDIQFGYGLNRGADFIREANFGLSPDNNLWIDGGYFFGEMSTIKPLPQENFFTSIPAISYIEPLVNAGLKASYKFNKNVLAKFVIFTDYNNRSGMFNKSKNFLYGVGIEHQVNSKLDFRINTLIGAENYEYFNGTVFEHTKFTRIFSNAFIKYNPGKKSKNNLGFMFIYRNKGELTFPLINLNKVSFGGFISSQYKILRNLSLSGRIEYFNDESGMYLNRDAFVTNQEELLLSGFTAAAEYNIREKIYARMEFNKKFINKNSRVYFDGKSNLSTFIASMGIEF